MNRRLVAFVLALSAALSPARAADPATRPDPVVVDRLATEALKRWKVPGVAVVIVRGDETTLLKGYGTKRLGADDPVTPDTLFPLASCTKAFTSTLAAMLVDEAELAWDDPVRKHLSTFHLSDPKADALVTMRDLLTHRTGVGGHDLVWYRAPWGIDESVRRIAHLPVAGQFRGEYHYNSLMYMAVGRALANRAGTPWEKLVRDRICTPFGMTGVAFTSAEADKFADRASGHRRTKAGAIEPMAAYPMPEPNPAGSLHATARDLGAWLKFQLADGVAGGRRLASAANLSETKTPQTLMRKDGPIGPIYPDSVQVSYAMGWVVYDHRGHKVVAHGGVVDGFRPQVTLLPDEKLGFALLNNLHETKMNIALGNALIDHLLGLEPKDWNGYFLKVEADERDAKRAEIDRRNRDRKPGTSPSLPLDKYAGEYRDAGYGTGKVTARDGRLVWEWSSFRCPLEHFQDDVFRVTEGYFEDELVEFTLADGRPSSLRAYSVTFERK
jgi:CubicO group peptidase (beta-lactamase class C family)